MAGSITFGDRSIDKVYFGDREVTSISLGDIVLYEATPTPTGYSITTSVTNGSVSQESATHIDVGDVVDVIVEPTDASTYYFSSISVTNATIENIYYDIDKWVISIGSPTGNVTVNAGFTLISGATSYNIEADASCPLDFHTEPNHSGLIYENEILCVYLSETDYDYPDAEDTGSITNSTVLFNSVDSIDVTWVIKDPTGDVVADWPSIEKPATETFTLMFTEDEGGGYPTFAAIYNDITYDPYDYELNEPIEIEVVPGEELVISTISRPGMSLFGKATLNEVEQEVIISGSGKNRKYNCTMTPEAGDEVISSLNLDMI